MRVVISRQKSLYQDQRYINRTQLGGLILTNRRMIIFNFQRACQPRDASLKMMIPARAKQSCFSNYLQRCIKIWKRFTSILRFFSTLTWACRLLKNGALSTNYTIFWQRIVIYVGSNLAVSKNIHHLVDFTKQKKFKTTVI